MTLMNVLFLCTHNSCRSVMAEAIFNHLAPAGWKAMSAGSQPSGQINARALAELERHGIATDGYHSKSWDDLPLPDVVITVCSDAAGETCPAYLGQVVRAHWGVDDPSRLQKTSPPAPQQAIDQAFDRAYQLLYSRIQAFMALPLDTLQQDQQALAAALDRIGQIGQIGQTGQSGNNS